MDIDHNTLVAFAKSGGLFYFIAFSLAVLVYTFWPSNRKKFDRAKRDILEHEDRPAAETRRRDEDRAQADRPAEEDRKWR